MKRQSDKMIEDSIMMRRVLFWCGFAAFVVGMAAFGLGVCASLGLFR